MSKILVLNNGTSIPFTDESTIYQLTTVFESFAEVDDILENVTTETLKGATFDGELIENIVVVRVYADSDGVGNVIVHVDTRDRSSEEIMNEKILDLELAVAELAEEL